MARPHTPHRQALAAMLRRARAWAQARNMPGRAGAYAYCARAQGYPNTLGFATWQHTYTVLHMPGYYQAHAARRKLST